MILYVTCPLSKHLLLSCYVKVLWKIEKENGIKSVFTKFTTRWRIVHSNHLIRINAMIKQHNDHKFNGLKTCTSVTLLLWRSEVHCGSHWPESKVLSGLRFWRLTGRIHRALAFSSFSKPLACFGTCPLLHFPPAHLAKSFSCCISLVLPRVPSSSHCMGPRDHRAHGDNQG